MTILSFRRLFALLPLFVVTTVLHAQEAYTPAAGSKERKAIMDALRVPCERDLKQEVIFVVDSLKVSDGWAAVRVTPQKPSGGRIDYSRTKYKEAAEAGMFSGSGEALLRTKGGPEAWQVVKWRFGATDTELSIWIKERHAPASLDE